MKTINWTQKVEQAQEKIRKANITKKGKQIAEEEITTLNLINNKKGW